MATIFLSLLETLVAASRLGVLPQVTNLLVEAAKVDVAEQARTQAKIDAVTNRVKRITAGLSAALKEQ